jgi:PAS domain S-box-containing protein
MNDDQTPRSAADMVGASAVPAPHLQPSHLLSDDGPSPALFQQLAETLPALCWMATAEGEVTWANPQWHAFAGTTPQQAAAVNWASLFDADELPAVLEGWTAAIASGQPFDMVFSMTGADGRGRPFLTRAAPARDAAGRVTGWFGINTEVVELRQQRQTAEDDTRRIASELDDLQRLFAQSPSFMAMLRGPDHRIVLANSPYMQLVGHREVLGRTVAEALPDAAEQGYVDLLDQVYRSGEAYTSNGAKYAVQAVPGGPIIERFVDFVYQPVTGPNGTIIGIFVEGSDVTVRVEAEAELQAFAAEKAALAHQNELMAREMSHRIMNSFQLMESMFSMQTRAISDPVARQVVDQAGDRIHAMAVVHRQLFRITRDDIKSLDVGEYLRGLADELGPAFITANRCTIHVEVDQDIAASTGQGMALGLLVTELVINACKHAFKDGDAGHIHVRLHRISGERHRLIVEDDGAGMPEDFDAKASSGLGMRLLNSFVRQLDGSLEVEGPPGTRFTITYPR